METLLVIYAILVFAIVVVGLFWAGYESHDHFETEEFVFNIIILSVVWPILLLLLCLYAPFWLIYKLGFLLRKRKDKGNKVI